MLHTRPHVVAGNYELHAPKAVIPIARRFVDQKRSTKCRSKNKIGDMDLLDFVTAGPKMRKWYGQGPRPQGDDQDPSPSGQQEQEPTREYVLVTDADSPMGEQVVLQLILARAKTRVLVRDVPAAKSGYGPYVDPVSTSLDSPGGLAGALRGVSTLVVLGRLGGLLPAAARAGVQQVVLLSTAGMPGRSGWSSLWAPKEDAVLADPAREQALGAAGVPHIILRTTGALEDTPGGTSSLNATRLPPGPPSSSGSSAQPISREDLAAAVVGCVLGVPPQAAEGGLVLQVVASGPGQPPADWQQLMSSLTTAT